MTTETKTQEQRTKAIAIATDGLLQLEARHIVPAHGVYHQFRSPQYNMDLSTAVKEPCSACAIGSLFVVAYDKYDGPLSEPVSIDYHGIYNRYAMLDYLTSAFSPQELEDIEDAFEHSKIELPILMQLILDGNGTFTSPASNNP